MEQDWRLNETTIHLREKTIKKMLYGQRKSTATHDHCEFCMRLFYEGPTRCEALLQGYTTLDEYYWICEKCYQDFSALYKWVVDKELSVDTLVNTLDTAANGFWYDEKTKELLHPHFNPPARTTTGKAPKQTVGFIGIRKMS